MRERERENILESQSPQITPRPGVVRYREEVGAHSLGNRQCYQGRHDTACLVLEDVVWFIHEDVCALIYS